MKLYWQHEKAMQGQVQLLLLKSPVQHGSWDKLLFLDQGWMQGRRLW